MSVSIVLADDHQVVRKGLRVLLDAEPGLIVLAEASDGGETLEVVERCRPDVLVLDLVMPGMGGLSVLKELAARKLATRVVVLSMHANEAYVSEARHAGAFGYVVKDASASDLVRAIHAAAAGQRFLSPPLSESAVEAYAHRIEAASREPWFSLTTREREVLQLAAQGHTSREIGNRLTISRRTAETHRANLMRKLGLKGQKDLIRYALRRNLMEL